MAGSDAYPPPPPPVVAATAAAKVNYFFADWSGPESACDLCTTYLDELKEIVEDGCQKGFISG